LNEKKTLNPQCRVTVPFIAVAALLIAYFIGGLFVSSFPHLPISEAANNHATSLAKHATFFMQFDGKAERGQKTAWLPKVRSRGRSSI
jgi:hypothetical protein